MRVGVATNHLPSHGVCAKLDEGPGSIHSRPFCSKMKRSKATPGLQEMRIEVWVQTTAWVVSTNRAGHSLVRRHFKLGDEETHNSCAVTKGRAVQDVVRFLIHLVLGEEKLSAFNIHDTGGFRCHRVNTPCVSVRTSGYVLRKRRSTGIMSAGSGLEATCRVVRSHVLANSTSGCSRNCTQLDGVKMSEYGCI